MNMSESRRGRKLPSAWALGLVLATSASGVGVPAAAQAPTEEPAQFGGIHRSVLAVVTGLASETTPSERAVREAALDSLQRIIEHLAQEHSLVSFVGSSPPDPAFKAAVVTVDTSAVGYLRALNQADARLRGAQEAEDGEWASHHFEAVTRFARAAQQSLEAHADRNEGTVNALAAHPFSARRSLQQSEGLKARLREDGLLPEEQRLLAEGGMTAEAITAYEEELRATAPEEIGISIQEFYQVVVDRRRELAISLADYSAAGARAPAMFSHEFMLENPHDQNETLDLKILRAAVPPEWHLALVVVDSVAADGSPLQLHEINAGNHYRLDLQARERIRVATVLTPIGVLGRGTTARWAVEGWIGDELLGGIVQEMHVPASGAAAAAVVPPISLEQPFGLDRRWLVAAAGAGLLLLLLTVVMARRRRRHLAGSP